FTSCGSDQRARVVSACKIIRGSFAFIFLECAKWPMSIVSRRDVVMSGEVPRSLKTASEQDRTEVQPGQVAPESAGQPPGTVYDGEIPPLIGGGPPYLVPGYDDWHFLGAGTFGEVWKARQTATTMLVAIKFFVRSAAGVENEVRRLAQLVHSPGIIRLEGF